MTPLPARVAAVLLPALAAAAVTAAGTAALLPDPGMGSGGCPTVQDGTGLLSPAQLRDVTFAATGGAVDVLVRVDRAGPSTAQRRADDQAAACFTRRGRPGVVVVVRVDTGEVVAAASTDQGRPLARAWPAAAAAAGGQLHGGHTGAAALLATRAAAAATVTPPLSARLTRVVTAHRFTLGAVAVGVGTVVLAMRIGAVRRPRGRHRAGRIRPAAWTVGTGA